MHLFTVRFDMESPILCDIFNRSFLYLLILLNINYLSRAFLRDYVHHFDIFKKSKVEKIFLLQIKNDIQVIWFENSQYFWSYSSLIDIAHR